MSSIYDRADIYDMLEDKIHLNSYKKHWQTILQGKNIQSFVCIWKRESYISERSVWRKILSDEERTIYK